LPGSVSRLVGGVDEDSALRGLLCRVGQVTQWERNVETMVGPAAKATLVVPYAGMVKRVCGVREVRERVRELERQK
jgi:hypothetical protein